MPSPKPDPDAERLLEHASFLRGLARSLVWGDRQLAEDAVQQAWLSILRRPPRHAANLRGWLATVLRHQISSLRRSESRRRRHEEAAGRPDAAPGTDELAERVELQRLVVAAVAELDEPYRAVIVLRHFDGLSVRETARRLGLPIETVRTRHRRAVSLLRAKLDRGWHGDRRRLVELLLPLAGAGWLAAAASAASAASTATLALAGGLALSAKKGLVVTTVVAVVTVLGVWRMARDPDEGARDRAAVAGRNSSAQQEPIEEPEEREGGSGLDPFNPPLVYEARVVEYEGGPIEGVEVSLISTSEEIELDRRVARTGTKGRFRIVLPSGDAGRLQLVLRHPEFYSPIGSNHLSFARETPEPMAMVRGAPLTVLVTGPGGRPVQGARVEANLTVQGIVLASQEAFGWSDTFGEGVTDADGIARPGAAPSGDVTVLARHERFASGSTSIKVEGTGPRTVKVRLAEPASVSGRVLGLDDEPVEGARVFPTWPEGPGTRTDAEGRFHLTGLDAGEHYLVAEADAGGVALFSARAGWRQAQPVRLAAGEQHGGIEIRLRPATWIRGRLIDERDKPVADVRVVSWSQSDSLWIPDATTDPEGRFLVGPCALDEDDSFQLHFDTDHWASFGTLRVHVEPIALAGLEPGEDLDLGDVKARARAFLRGRVLTPDGGAASAGQVVIKGDADTWAYAPIHPDGTFAVRFVGPGELTLYAELVGTPSLRSGDLRIRVEPGARRDDVLLRLRPCGSIEGRAASAAGTARTQVRIGCVPASLEPPYPYGEVQTTWCDPEGRFSFPLLVPGAYLVGVIEETGLTVAFRDTPPPVAVPVGATATRVELTLPGGGLAVQARVVDDRTGRPVPRYTAGLLRYSSLIPRLALSSNIRDADGYFRLEAEEKGLYAVEIRAEGYANLRTLPFRLGGTEQRDLGEIRLGPIGALVGVVRDAGGGHVPQARLQVLNALLQTNPGETFSDTEGRFRVGSLAPGRYNVFAISPDHPIGIAREVDVRSGGETELEIVMPEITPLRVRILDQTGAPIRNASLVYALPAMSPLTSHHVRRFEPTTFGDNHADSDGWVRKPLLPPGPITLTVEAPGFETAVRTLEREPGETTELEVRLTRSR